MRSGPYRVVAAPVLGVLAAGVDVVGSGGVEGLGAVGLVLPKDKNKTGVVRRGILLVIDRGGATALQPPP